VHQCGGRKKRNSRKQKKSRRKNKTQQKRRKNTRKNKSQKKKKRKYKKNKRGGDSCSLKGGSDFGQGSMVG
jgi:hypothetical protein